jgi:FixJ family two-component response regulator
VKAKATAQPFQTGQRAVLVVDDDRGTRETAEWVLRAAGCHVRAASSGVDGMAMARSGLFDLLLVDLRLPDMLGTDMVRALRTELTAVPFVLVSAFLTTEVTVEAMRLGASDVIEKPMTTDHLRTVVLDALDRRPVSPVVGMEPRSAAERWALHVLKACEHEGDLKTLDDWAECAGVSTSSLCESCHLVGIQPRDARDFTRLLRALLRSHTGHCDLKVLLNVNDRRTLNRLLERGGLAVRSGPGSVSLDRFFSRQQFVARENEGLRILRRRLEPSNESG